MNLLITESQLELINDILLEYAPVKNNFAEFIRLQLRKIYEPTGNWGKAPNPNNNCETGLGVINVFPHSDEDVWSILNRFDTNSKVKNKMFELFKDSGATDLSEKSFMDWISQNAQDLFVDGGTYTQTLIDLNKETIEKGNRNELYAINILRQRFPNSDIVRFCAGDIRDTKNAKNGVLHYTNIIAETDDTNKPSYKCILELVNKILSKFGITNIEDTITEFTILDMMKKNTVKTIMTFIDEMMKIYDIAFQTTKFNFNLKNFNF